MQPKHSRVKHHLNPYEYWYWRETISNQEDRDQYKLAPSSIPYAGEGPMGIGIKVENSRGTGLNSSTRTVIQTLRVSNIQKAQGIISNAEGKGEDVEKKAITNVISILYPYAPYDGQRDALQQLIYWQKDLILIAKTSFGKSMIL
jgi:hypothetical protein